MNRIFNTGHVIPADVTKLMDPQFTVWTKTSQDGTFWTAEDGRVLTLVQIRNRANGRALVEVA